MNLPECIYIIYIYKYHLDVIGLRLTKKVSLGFPLFEKLSASKSEYVITWPFSWSMKGYTPLKVSMLPTFVQPYRSILPKIYINLPLKLWQFETILGWFWAPKPRFSGANLLRLITLEWQGFQIFHCHRALLRMSAKSRGAGCHLGGAARCKNLTGLFWWKSISRFFTQFFASNQGFSRPRSGEPPSLENW